MDFNHYYSSKIQDSLRKVIQMRRFLFSFVLICLVTPLLAFANDLSKEELREDFDFFWRSYEEAYVFWELKGKDYGVDWQQMRQEYTPTLEQCQTKKDLLRLITEMQTRLHDGHCGNEGMTSIGPLALVRGLAFTPTAGREICVKVVMPNSPPALEGVERGDKVLIWDGKPIASLARRARSLIGASSEGQFWSIFAQLLNVHHPYLGEADEKCVCSFEKPDGTVIEAEFDWNVIDPSGGKAGPSISEIIELDAEGPLPMKAMIFEGLNVAYIKVESFMKQEFPKEQLDRVFSAIKDTKALILDLRNNGGGVGPWGVLLANYMIEEGADEAYMDRKYSRTFFRSILANAPAAQVEAIFKNPSYMKMILGKLGIEMTVDQVREHFVDGEYVPFYHRTPLAEMVPQDLSPGVEAYDKEIYALCNGGCYSTTDICLKLLKEFNRAKLIGSPNGAGSGSPIPMLLPNCKVNVMVPHARAFPPSGEMIEGRPLDPDVIVETTQEDLVTGRDPHLITALRLIQEESVLENDIIRKGSSRFRARLAPAFLDAKTLMDTRGSKIPEDLAALIPAAVREARLKTLPKIDLEDLN